MKADTAIYEQDIARICHEANRAYCRAIGDNSQQPWDEAPQWQRSSALLGVQKILANPDTTPRESHESWLRVKSQEGWKHGSVKDVDKKEHPCFLPYDELPDDQKRKDILFTSIVKAMIV